ncbi:MAG: helix-turn-helix domain-containing protein [Pseudolabrys sp.]|jgi:AraC-like DNA-binding protein
MQYLSQWRIHLAAASLAQAGVTISEAAAEVGYASESAFYRAFQRTLGLSPAAWRDQAQRWAASDV